MQVLVTCSRSTCGDIEVDVVGSWSEALELRSFYILSADRLERLKLITGAFSFLFALVNMLNAANIDREAYLGSNQTGEASLSLLQKAPRPASGKAYVRFDSPFYPNPSQVEHSILLGQN